MNELDSFMNLTELTDDEDLDIASIFGDPSPAQPPPGEPAAAQQACPVQSAEPEAPQNAPALDFFSALTTEQQPQKTTAPADPKAQVSLFDKPPVFSYGGVKENITDAAISFEELRIQKADDFPELEEGKSVSWRVRYGSASKAISDPKGTTILQIKHEIERSKAFLDSLKKGKDKDPVCLVTPTVTAKSKGIAAYKGMFPSLETARASDKVICLIPARNGQVYELRKHELGEFIAPKHNITELSEIRAGFRPALPRIPRELLDQIIAFFRSFLQEKYAYEALVQVYWDRVDKAFFAFVPKQTVSKAHIQAETGNAMLPEDRYLHYADIHSHNSMAAKFSTIDDKDERPTGIYIVIGHLERFFPDVAARVSCGGNFQEINPALVLEQTGAQFPEEWTRQVTLEEEVNSPHPWLDNLMQAVEGGDF